MTEKSTIYLIDGTAQAYKAFYAIQSLSTSKGFPTNAIFGFIRMLLKLIQDESPQYLCVSFDLAAPTFRHELFEAYKAHRPETPDELIQQIPKIKEFLRAMNIPIYEMEGYEADDVLATFAKKAEQQGMKAVIVSSDKDLLQLVSENIVTLSERMGHRVIYTPEKVKEKFGVNPEQIQDFLGLVGDSSDNIPGIKGIGPKTASKLLEEFGSVENVLDHLDAVASKKQRESLEQGREIALQSKFLATVKTDVPFELDVEEVQYTPPNYQDLKEFLHDLEFYSFIRELIPAEEFGYPPFAEEESSPQASSKQYETILTEAQLERLIDELRRSQGFAVDTETTSEQPMKAELVGISAAITPHQAYYIPVGHRYIGAPKQLPLDLVIQHLKPLLEDEHLPKYGQNIKYDIIVLAHYGVHSARRGLRFDAGLLCARPLQTQSWHGSSGAGIPQLPDDYLP